MSTVPPLPPAAAGRPVPHPGVLLAHDRWMHDLRNELNTAMMAAAAARRLLQAGDTAEALANVHRVEAACLRCGQLLRDSGPQPT